MMREKSIDILCDLIWKIDWLFEDVMKILKTEGIDTDELRKGIKELKEGRLNEQSGLDKTS